MDAQTWIGIGAGAVFALAGLTAPMFGWEVSGPIMALCIIAAIWGFWPLVTGARRIPQWFPSLGRIKLNPYIAIGVVFALLSATAFALYFRDRSIGPIIWTWGPNSPVGFSMETGAPLRADGFNIIGRNRSDDSIIPIKAYIKSNVTNRIVSLMFNEIGKGPVAPDQVVIPPKMKFSLGISLPSTDARYSSGIFAEAFRVDFARFTFMFEYEGGAPYIIKFVESDVDNFIAGADRVNREALEKARELSPFDRLRRKD